MGFDDLLQFGTVFDWISPTLSVIGDITNGGGYTFLIPEDCGWTGHEIAKMLHGRGIKTWGHMNVNSTFMISVKPSQASFARYLLERAGLPIGAEAERQAQRRRQEPERKTRSSLGAVFEIFGRVRL